MSFTPRLLLLIAALAITAGVGVWVGDWMARAWMLPSLLLLLLVWAEFLLSKRYQLALTRTAPGEVELGRTLQIDYQLRVQPARHFQLELAERMPESLAGSDWQEQMQLNEQGVHDFFIKRQTQALAVLHFESVQARVLGVFALVWWPRELHAPLQVRVIPQALTEAERRRFTSPLGSSEVRKRGQGSELLNLRDYVPGDPQRAIDWKASARGVVDSNQISLKVRVMSQEQNLELVILLDVSRRSGLSLGNMRRFDCAINVASRLGQASLGAGDQLHVIAYDEAVVAEQFNLRGISGLQQLRSLLANTAMTDRESDPIAACAKLQSYLKKRALVVFLSDSESPAASEKLVRAVSALKRKHLPLVCTWLDPELLQLAKRHDASLRWRAPAQRLAALELQQEHRLHTQALRALGAYVVQATPEAMDEHVLSAYSDVRRRKRV
jgi:uncharacterized protein (DUF58 family)